MFEVDRVLRALVEGASDAVFVAEVQTGIIVYANRAAGKMFECLPEELNGIHQAKLHPDDEFKYIEKKFNEFTASDSYKETTAYILTHTGRRKLVLITAANLFEIDAKKYAAAYFKDISHIETLKEIAYYESHVIRRPLANIIAISRLLKDDIFSDVNEREVLINDLCTEAEQMDLIVRKISTKATT